MILILVELTFFFGYSLLPPILSAKAIETSGIKLDLPLKLLRLKFPMALNAIIYIGGAVFFFIANVHKIEHIAFIPLGVLQIALSSLWISLGKYLNM